MDGKVCVITGATSGIGKIAAESLAQKGATLVIIGRDEEKGRSLMSDLGHDGKHAYIRADLGSLAEVREAAHEIYDRYPAIDVLINNAGLISPRRVVTKDEFELTFAVNHLAHFLLTGLLLDRIRGAAKARIINVSSNAHTRARLDLDDLQLQRGYRAFKAYGRSKLANLYFTFELATRLRETGVTVNALHPGFVATNFGQNHGWLGRLGMWLGRPFAITPEEGAKTIIYLANSPEVEDITGRYFYRCREAEPAEIAKDAAIARRLWELSEEMTDFPYRSSLLPPNLVTPIFGPAVALKQL